MSKLLCHGHGTVVHVFFYCMFLIAKRFGSAKNGVRGLLATGGCHSCDADRVGPSDLCPAGLSAAERLLARLHARPVCTNKTGGNHFGAWMTQRWSIFFSIFIRMSSAWRDVCFPVGRWEQLSF